MAHKSRWHHLTVRQLRARRARLARRLPDLETTLYGSLQQQTRRCGEPGCHCATGEPHGPYLYLAVRVEGRTRMQYVPATAAATTQRHIALTGQIEATLADISAINRELLARGALD
jgi:hypothetical protein